MSVMVCGDQITQLYSNRGLTYVTISTMASITDYTIQMICFADLPLINMNNYSLTASLLSYLVTC